VWGNTMHHIAEWLENNSVPLFLNEPMQDAAVLCCCVCRLFDCVLCDQVTSSAKKKRSVGSSHIHQTPEGAFFDLQRNAWQVGGATVCWTRSFSHFCPVCVCGGGGGGGGAGLGFVWGGGESSAQGFCVGLAGLPDYKASGPASLNTWQ